MQMKLFEKPNDLNHKDMVELGGGRKRVRTLMQDGQWHSAEEIRQVAEGSEGLRRLRELRKKFYIEKRRISGSRHFEYRMAVV